MDKNILSSERKKMVRLSGPTEEICQFILSDISFIVGDEFPLKNLLDDPRISEFDLEKLSSYGFSSFRRFSSSAEANIADCIARTMRSSSVPIGGAVVMHSSENMRPYVDELVKRAIPPSPRDKEVFLVSGVGDCSCLDVALLQCQKMLRSPGFPSGHPVLLILSGIHDPSVSRFHPIISTVFSDGVVSALVWDLRSSSSRSRGRQSFQIVGFGHASDPSLLMDQNVSAIARMQGAISLLQAGVANFLQKKDMLSSDVRILIGNNTSLPSLELLMASTGISRDRTWLEGLNLGHCYAADGLISVKCFANANKMSPQDLALIVGWAPHAISSVIFRFC